MTTENKTIAPSIKISMDMLAAIPGGASFSDVFNAVSLATAALVVDYLVTNDEEVNEDTIKAELSALFDTTMAAGKHVIKTADLEKLKALAKED